MTKEKIHPERDYSIDLLRIVSMFMIVSLHSVSHGVSAKMGGVNIYNVWFHFESSICILAVNIYVLISGFFLVKEQFRLSKLYKMVMETVFYSWIILAVLYTQGRGLGIRSIVSSLMPVSYNQYWFVSAYIGMYILSPVLNLLIRSISQKQLIGIICIFAVYFSIWNSVIPYSQPMGIHRFGQSVMWFVVLYTISAYVRLYVGSNIPKPRVALIFILSIVFMNLSWLLSVGAGAMLGISLSGIITEYYYHYNSFPVLLASVSLFMWFRTIRIENIKLKKMIRFAAPLCFGVYLIHDNPNMRDIVWGKLSNIEVSKWLPLVSAVYASFIFIICLIIDYLRSLFFGLLNQRVWYKSFLLRMDRNIYFIYERITNKYICK